VGCLYIAVVVAVILAAGIVPLIGDAAYIGTHYVTPLLVIFFITIGIILIMASTIN
jgi:hypothetical protein